ncbi:hypothetical protein A5780_26785 [Nocardia sp. 852002-20019_SCH5090214]|uniref:hypothetical protein n=1 Tax=Nocardia sp. 852002-20019_SCH5090214 TaxID=1834087 RepID=UPI0007E9EAB2|nr:hypothetical protein [Nocardia sp. 852002-20019_SCH5090214]OBA53442.1 hypothetical protein A5780_26785 [Nocardia sp. 852002-20019_SCH5090214]
MASDLTTWQQRAAEARAGDLYLDDEQVARDCLAACNKRIEDLEDMNILVDRVKMVTGFGDFDMGHMLEGQFKLQASGDDNSIDKIVADHIETVKNMREVMAISLARLTGQDYTNSTTLNGIIDQNPAPQK